MPALGRNWLVKPWEAAVLVLPVVLIVAVVVLNSFGFSRILVASIFVVLPFSMGVWFIVADFVRGRYTNRRLRDK